MAITYDELNRRYAFAAPKIDSRPGLILPYCSTYVPFANDALRPAVVKCSYCARPGNPSEACAGCGALSWMD